MIKNTEDSYIKNYQKHLKLPKRRRKSLYFTWQKNSSLWYRCCTWFYKFKTNNKKM